MQKLCTEINIKTQEHFVPLVMLFCFFYLLPNKMKARKTINKAYYYFVTLLI